MPPSPSWVTRHELQLVEARFHDSVKELRESMREMPQQILDMQERKRREDRRQFMRDTFALIVGVATIVGVVLATITMFGGHHG